MTNILQYPMIDEAIQHCDYQLSKIDLKKPVRFMNVERALQQYSSITLEEMDSVKLLNRVDTKYVFPANLLLPVLATLQSEYRVLVINGRCLNRYRTLYFDTPDFRLFNLHVNGNAERYKVRSREYIDTQESFLEVKHKNRKNRTIKQRLEMQHPSFEVDDEAEGWLEEVYPFNPAQLEAKIWITFTRVTLVNPSRCERVTVDLDIRFFNTESSSSLENVAVAEVKMDAQNSESPFKIQMRNLHIHQNGFSKYCLGTSLLYNQVKKNALKPKLLWIEKISKGANYE